MEGTGGAQTEPEMGKSCYLLEERDFCLFWSLMHNAVHTIVCKDLRIQSLFVDWKLSPQKVIINICLSIYLFIVCLHQGLSTSESKDLNTVLGSRWHR